MYSELISRNYLYIDPTTQSKIKNSRIAFFGSGLASTAAEYAVRTGFSNILICDGDNVEVSNLNRQAFTHKDIGRKKVFSLKKKLLEINPEIVVHTHSTYIESIDEIHEEIEKSDIIINTVDCDRTYFDLIEDATLRKKLVICPFNPGYGGLVACFSYQSASAYEMFKCKDPIDDIEIAKKILDRFPDICKKQKISNKMFIDSVHKNNYFPQLIIGGAIASSLVVTNMIKYLRDEPISLAPNFQYLSSW